MRTHVIGVVRGARQLQALAYEAGEPADAKAPWLRVETYGVRPLGPEAAALAAAWRALESVSDWGEATLGHVLAVLRGTVPAMEAAAELGALGVEVPAAPRATAAHPRAYRGTKHRPPKPRQPEAVDVRAYLLTRRHTDQVLEQLGQPRGIEPYVVWNHGTHASATFDAAFVMYLLPLFRGRAWSEVGAFAVVARMLALHGDVALRAALVGVYLADPSHALAWWQHILAHAPDQRLETAQLVSASGAASMPPPDAELAAEVARLPATQRWAIYRGLRGGAQPAYLRAGLALDALSATRLEDIAPGTTDVTALIAATIARLATAMEEDSGAAFWRGALWRLCGHQPELVELLASPHFATLEPTAAFWLIRVAASPRHDRETADATWRALAPKLIEILALAASVAPAYQRKLVEDACDAYDWSIDNEHDIADTFARCLGFCVQRARPPFAPTPTIGPLLPAMALIDQATDDDRRTIRNAPEASWLALENACKRSNDLRLLQRGLTRLARYAPALMAATFSRSPAALIQTAETLAAISFERAAQLLTTFTRSALAGAPQALSLEAVCALIAPVAQAGGPNPVRRALRRHLAGDAPLSAAQLRGHHARLLADLDLVRLAAIRQAVERELASRLGADRIETPTMRHALAMLVHVDEHRRQLRRLLTAIAAGDHTWRLRHPRTQRWLARHPGLALDLWQRGIELRVTLPDLGDIRIAVEPDPLEALMLGTYVGSCLGRGGGLEYSAAAVVLDLNKHVVYARDARGTVVARQLLALSETEELVCFSVYGPANPAHIEPPFRAFDRAFAAALGIPLHTGSDYDIAAILSHSWWDDLAWS